MAFQTFGVKMVIQGASAFARDMAHMAMGVAGYTSTLEKFKTTVVKAAEAQTNSWARAVDASVKKSRVLETSFNRLNIQADKLKQVISNASIALAKYSRLSNPVTNPGKQQETYARNAAKAKIALDVLTKASQRLQEVEALRAKVEAESAANMAKGSNAADKHAEALSNLNAIQEEATKSNSMFGIALQSLLSNFGMSSSPMINFAKNIGMAIPQARALVLVLDVFVAGLGIAVFAIKAFLGVAQLFINILKKIWDGFVFGVKTIAKFAGGLIAIPFNFIKNGFTAIWQSLQRIGEIAIGMNLSNLIWHLGTQLKETGQAAWDAGVNFQLLQVRLRGLIQRELSETQGISFVDSLDIATKRAEDLSVWISKLGVKSIFSAQTIADTISLGMSYDMTEEKVKQLTTSTVAFATGMGLEDQEMRRIIENFGQMIAQGKLTGTEIRDLGRGGFVPVNAILQIMGKNLGYTGLKTGELKKKMQELVADGEVPIEHFFQAFNEFVGINFPNSIENASSSMMVVQSNIKDFRDTIVGWRVMTPVIEKISKRLANMLNMFMSDDVRNVAIKIGKGLGVITESIFNFFDKTFGKLDISKPVKIIGKFVDSMSELFNLPKSASLPVVQILKSFKDIANLGAGAEKKAGAIVKIFQSLKGIGFSKEQATSLTENITKFIEGLQTGNIDFTALKKIFGTAIDALYKNVIAPKFKEGWAFIKTNVPIWWNSYILPGLQNLWTNHLSPWISKLWNTDIPAWWEATGSPAVLGMIKNISTWFQNNYDTFKEVGSTIITNITQAIKDNSGEGSQFMTDVAGIMTALLQGALAIAIKGAFGLFASNVDTAINENSAGTSTSIDSLSTAINELKTTTRQALDESLLEFGEWLKNSNTPMGKFAKTVDDSLLPLGLLWDTIKNICITARQFVDTFIEWTALLADMLIPGLGDFIRGLGDLDGGISTFVSGSIIVALQFIDSFVLGVSNAILAIDGLVRAAANPAEAGKIFEEVKGKILGQTDGFIEKYRKAWATLKDDSVSEAQDMSDQLVGHSIFPDMYDAMTTVVEDGYNGMIDLTNSFKSRIIAVISSINLYDVAFRVVMSMWAGLIAGLGNAPSGLGGSGGRGSGSNGGGTAYNDPDERSAQVGADFVVPGGYENDGLRLRVGSGERVIVIPKYDVLKMKYKVPYSGNIMNNSASYFNNWSTNHNNYNLGVTTMASAPDVIRQFGIMRLENS